MGDQREGGEVDVEAEDDGERDAGSRGAERAVEREGSEDGGGGRR
jgi:hypothetical protein